MSHVEYVDAVSSVKALRIIEGQKINIKYGSNTNDQYVKVEHVVSGGKHILRAYTAQGRLIGVADYGNGQARHSSYEKALEALKKRLLDHLYTVATNKGVKTNGLY